MPVFVPVPSTVIGRSANHRFAMRRSWVVTPGTEDEIADVDLEDHIVQWPALLPKRARLKKRPQS